MNLFGLQRWVKSKHQNRVDPATVLVVVELNGMFYAVENATYDEPAKLVVLQAGREVVKP